MAAYLDCFNNSGIVGAGFLSYHLSKNQTMTPIQKAKEMFKAYSSFAHPKGIIKESNVEEWLATPEAAALLSGEDWKEDGVKELNAAQVLSKFMWKNKFPDSAITMNRERKIEIDQTELLPYLMTFQRFIFDYNKPLPEPPKP